MMNHLIPYWKANVLLAVAAHEYGSASRPQSKHFTVMAPSNDDKKQQQQQRNEQQYRERIECDRERKRGRERCETPWTMFDSIWEWEMAFQ